MNIVELKVTGSAARDERVRARVTREFGRIATRGRRRHEALKLLFDDERVAQNLDSCKKRQHKTFNGNNLDYHRTM